MNTIKILHLSDLQFGKSNRFVAKKRYSDNVNYETFAKSIVKEVISTWKCAPDIIAVTGDVAESATRLEYTIAKEFFKNMLIKFESYGNKIPIYIIPGNHDVNFAETQACTNTNELDKLFECKFKNFNDFLKSLSLDGLKVNTQLTNEHPYFIDKTCNDKLLVLGLNSAIDLTHENRRGIVLLRQLCPAIKEAEQLDPEGNAFRLVLVHHNFTRKSDIDDENLSDADSIQDFLINGTFQLLLHGHRHIAGAELRRNLVNGKQISILATGSAGLDSDRLPNVPNQFQLITIDIDSTVKISVQRKVFSEQTVGPQGRGEWSTDISEVKSGEFQFFIYPEDIRKVVELIQGIGFPISSKTLTIHFSKGFEDHLLYSTILEVAEHRLWILGRKNRKLFDKTSHVERLKKICEKRQKKGLDFRVLFLSPDAEENILHQAHKDGDLKDQLKRSIESASKILKEMGIEFNEICKSYYKERTIAMMVVDNAVLFKRIELDPNGQAKPLTDASFDVVSLNSTIGKDLKNLFNEFWESKNY